jgi:hypothetical protein
MGTLKAKVNGVWTSVSGNGQSAADVAKWNSAWGLIGSTASSDIAVAAAAPGTTIRSITATLTAGRQYVVEARQISSYMTSGTTSANSFQLYLDLDGAGYLSYSAAYPVIVDGGYVTPSNVSWNLTANTGSHTIAIRLARNSGTGTMQARFHLAVYDVGPVTPAAVAPPAATPRVVASGNALGIIGIGSFIPPFAPRTITNAVETVLTNPLPFYAAVGRRYRIKFQIRASANTAGAGSQSFYLRDNGTNVRGWPFGGDPYLWNAGAYQSIHTEWLLEGDGLQHSVELLCNGIGMSLFTDYGLWYVEDVGPNTSPATPIPETPPAWTQVSSFSNSWVNYGAGRPSTSYRKIGDLVELRVAVKSGTNGAAMFQLPVGFRPPYTFDFMGRDGTSAPAACLFNVNADGTVIPYSTGAAGFNNIVVLNCRYSTTP